MSFEITSSVDVNRLIEAVARRITGSGSAVRVVLDLATGLPEVRTDPAKLTELLSCAANAMMPGPRGEGARLALRTDRRRTAAASSADDVAVTLTGTPDPRTLHHALGRLRAGRCLVRIDGPDPVDTELQLTLRIPVDPQPRVSTPPLTPRGCVLLADDEHLFVASHERLIALHGFAVLTAETGDRAWSLLLEHREEVDWIVTDLRLPCENGTSLFERVRAELPAVRVVVMTGYANSSAIDALRERGAHAILIKPFDSDEMIQLLCAKTG